MAVVRSLSSVLFLTMISCSSALYTHPLLQNVQHKRLYAQSSPEIDKNIAIAKHTFLTIAAALLSIPTDVFTSPPMLEPRPSSPDEKEHRKLVSATLTKGWTKLDGFETSKADENVVDEAMNTQETDHNPSTYGEVTELGARQLFSYMKMKGSTDERGFNFFDLGSGAGKLVVQAYMEIPCLRRAVGVELAPARHAVAVRAWEHLKDTALDVRSGLEGGSEDNAVVEWNGGDLFELDVSEATHVYVASLCFTSEMMTRVARKLADEAVDLRCVATLKEFPVGFEERFGEARMEFVEMTWTKTRGQGCRVYFYTPS